MNTIKNQYYKLKKELNQDTRFHSNPHFWLEHDAYKSIVALGIDVVPIIIRELEKSLQSEKYYPGWWAMYALPEITGVRIKIGGPEVKVENGFTQVSVDDVSRFWVRWLEERANGPGVPSEHL